MPRKKKEVVEENIVEKEPKKEVKSTTKTTKTKKSNENTEKVAKNKKNTQKTTENKEEIKEPKKKTTRKDTNKKAEPKIKIEKYQKTVCEKCDELVDYTISYGNITEDIDGTKITYDALVCTCDKCGEILDPLNIDDFNMKKRDVAYRKKVGIIQVDELIGLISRDKRSLTEIAHATGVSESSIGNYMRGLRPLKKNSDMLKRKLSLNSKFSNIVDDDIED